MSAARGSAPRLAVVLHIHGLERPIAAPSGASDHYPPYDLLRTTPSDGLGETLRLVLAVAGFSAQQLEITVAGDQLLISGEQAGEVDQRRFLHRGIAGRRFRKAFRLASGLGVDGADLDRGLLSVTLSVQAAGPANRTISIGTPASPNASREP